MKTIAFLILASSLTSVFGVCPPFPDFPNSGIIKDCTNGRQIGSSCTISCPAGRKLKGGAEEIRCLFFSIWSHSLKRASCEYDEQCPSVAQDSAGVCTECPDECPSGEICCPTSCGSTCIVLPTACRQPATPPNSGIIFDCTDGNNLGSVCSVGCPVGQTLLGGVDEIVCMQSGIWSGFLIRSACVYDSRCPARRNPRTNVDMCEVCPESCPIGEICCPASPCGSKCIETPKTECEIPTTPPNSGILLDCSDEQSIGSVCAIRCAPGQMLLGGVTEITCRSSGSWSQSLMNSACVYDTRCPARRDVGGDNSSACPICPDRCAPGEICCPTGCGSTCIPAPRSTCSPPASPPNSNLIFDCSDELNVGSICTIRCRSGQYLLGGVNLIQCRSSNRWSSSLIRSACVYDVRCPPRDTSQDTSAGICSECPTNGCELGEICCGTGCGSTCIPIP